MQPIDLNRGADNVLSAKRSHIQLCGSPTPFMSISCVLLHGINLLHGRPFCTDRCVPTTIQVNWLHLLCLLYGFSLVCKPLSIGCVCCMGSIYCVGELFALSAVSPASFKSIGCVLLHGDNLLCGSQHHSIQLAVFVVWMTFLH